MSNEGFYAGPAIQDGGSGPVDGPASAPAQGQGLVGNASGGFGLERVSTVFSAASDSEMTSLAAKPGDLVLRTDEGLTRQLKQNGDPTVTNDWRQVVLAPDPAQGDVLRGNASGGYDLAGFRTYTITGDGQTIPVQATDRVLNAEVVETDPSPDTWTATLGDGSYVGQALTLLLRIEITGSDEPPEFVLVVDNLGVKLEVDFVFTGNVTSIDAQTYEVVWDGSKWGIANPGPARLGTTITGRYAYAEGADTTASGDLSHAEGNNTTASGSRSHAEGYSTTASLGGSHAEGRGTTASSSYSHAEGRGTTASGARSHAEGEGAEAYLSDQHASANEEFANVGDAQHTRDVRKLGGASGSMSRTIPTNKALVCYVQVIAAESGMGSVGCFVRQFAIKNDGGTTALVGMVDAGPDRDPGAVGYGVSITADDSGNNLSIDVSGGNSGTRWVATIYATEVSNPA